MKQYMCDICGKRIKKGYTFNLTCDSELVDDFDDQRANVINQSGHSCMGCITNFLNKILTVKPAENMGN